MFRLCGIHQRCLGTRLVRVRLRWGIRAWEKNIGDQLSGHPEQTLYSLIIRFPFWEPNSCHNRKVVHTIQINCQIRKLGVTLCYSHSTQPQIRQTNQHPNKEIRCHICYSHLHSHKLGNLIINSTVQISYPIIELDVTVCHMSHKFSLICITSVPHVIECTKRDNEMQECTMY